MNESTYRRWEVKSEIPSYRIDAIRQRILPLITATPKDGREFTFIDLFAGIGGIRLGFEAQGGKKPDISRQGQDLRHDIRNAAR
ncbi:MAG: DNA cytosine methyltransferase [Haliea sp.]|nr:DNA cytosine methyltransferase [Haliea sp.]